MGKKKKKKCCEKWRKKNKQCGSCPLPDMLGKHSPKKKKRKLLLEA